MNITARNLCCWTIGWVIGTHCLPAAAVYLNSDGLGQALIYPYFTAQTANGNPFNTYLSVVNTSRSSAKVARVRVREGRNSKEIAVFNLYLAPVDTWTAAIVPTVQGARVISADASCVNGAFTQTNGIATLEFTNRDFTDGLGTGPERLREGYVELIEMATLTGASAAAVTPTGGAVVPPNCAAVQGDRVDLQTAAPDGGLAGTLTLINVDNGSDFTVKADALAELTAAPFYRNYNDPYPDFNSSEVVPVSHFTDQGKAYRFTWASGIDAVASAMLASTVFNEVVLDKATNSGTDWVLTMPLRRFGRPITPPTTAYPPSVGAGQSIETLAFTARDGSFSRSARMVTQCVVQCPGATYETSPSLPWASTVATFRTGVASASFTFPPTSAVVGSRNTVQASFPLGAENGSASFEFLNAMPFQGSSLRISDGAVSSESGRLNGVPVVGFMVRTFQNGTLACGNISCQGNYGGAFSHRVGRSVLPP
jgi:hypothetical protein